MCRRSICRDFFTAHFAQRQYRKDEINRVRPYLSLTYLHAKSKVNPLELLNQAEEPREEDWTYKEEKLNRIFVILENDCIVYKDDLTPSQQKIVEQGGLRWKRQSNSAMQLVSEDYLSCPIEAYNVGSGAMVNLQFGFYHDEGTRRGVSFYTLKPDDNIYLHLFSDALDETTCGDYILEFIYFDILGTKYSQKYPFTIKKQEGKNGYISTIDFTGEQIRT